MRLTGLYPGTFDPVTNGHLDVIARACAIVDRLVIAIGVHHGKEPLFSADERIEMLQRETAGIAENSGAVIDVVTFDGLVVDMAREEDATLLFRGLRNGTDFDYEIQMAGMNGAMAPEVQTVFLPASAEVRHIAASLVRQIASMGGDVDAFVPPLVAERLREHYGS
ncbi:MAG: pantetheine-phosphate adenylyltransferase [Hyphomicrobiales bacterium]|jgi:pantetheine-phosphate adenylyltransferase|nr:pantetheine-phosphate adenylyltransferase [Hyphomicrobiales bacterium]